MSSQYGELRPTNGWDRLGSLGHARKFQQVSRLGVVTAPTSFNRGQSKFAQCLAVSRTGHCIYISGRSCPLTDFWQSIRGFTTMRYINLRFTYLLCVQIWRSPILAALLHGTRALDISQTATFSRGHHLYLAGRPSHWALSHILVFIWCG